MRVFSITGWSGSGKTTLITRLIKHLKMKDRKVIAVKNVPHKYYLEPESKDTFKFLDAGSDEVCLVAGKQLVTMKKLIDTHDVVDLLKAKYSDYDVLLLEGLHKPGIPMIEVFNASEDESDSKHSGLKNPVSSLVAVVSDEPVTSAIPVFSRNDIEEIVHFMEV